MNKRIEYPYNLLSDIYPYKDNFGTFENFDDLLDKIFNETGRFTERDIACIKKYYKDKLTYSAIAKEYNISGSRIRQIIVKVLRKLHHPYILKTYIFPKVDKND